MAGIGAAAERGVGAERLQDRQVEPKGVGQADGGLGIRHADMDVEAARRGTQQAAEVLADDLVTGF